jgi:hypothetical protein
MRKYKSEISWCFWRWTEVDTGYITRLHLVKTPWFAICLHWLNHSDPEPYLHDHPVTFLSLILRGWYFERRIDGFYGRHWFNFIRATDRHTIVLVGPRTLTLCFMGPKVQDWGFYVPNDDRRVGWQDYYDLASFYRGLTWDRAKNDA